MDEEEEEEEEAEAEEEEEERVTDETSWILLGMPTRRAYKTMTMEYRNCREKVMAGD
jgi:hypothetical protein